VRFNPPPGWPTPPQGWTPPRGWRPDPSWPPPLPGWQLWLPDDADTEQTLSGPPAEQPDDQLRGAQRPSAAGAADNAVHDSVSAPMPARTADSPDGSIEVAALKARIGDLEGTVAALRAATERPAAVGQEDVELSDQRVLQDVGIYRYHHPLEDAAAYRGRLEEIESQIDQAVRTGQAILAADLFTFAGSLAKGRKMVSDLSKLMLRAYNAEADNCVRSMRSGNVTTAKRRLENAVTAIEKLGAMMDMRVNPDYHALRLAELELTADYQMKVQEERERAREERALLREQQRVERELAAEKQRLEKEREHYLNALQSLRASGDTAAAADLAARLDQIDRAIADNDYRIANIRAGYVYVISNIGAFGPNIVKIGMTRRLEPRDRIRELGDASVPFTYDTHALFFSDDAVTLENQLHHHFASRRVNWVNNRREFFFTTPSEVRQVLATRFGGLLEYNDTPEAAEYFQSRSSWPPLDSPPV